MNHLFAWAIADSLGTGMKQVDPLAQECPALTHRRRRLRFQDQLHLVGKLVHRAETQSQGHAPGRAHRVDGDRES
jgi:hypothetical protein